MPAAVNEVLQARQQNVIYVSVFTGLDQGIIQHMAATRAAGTTSMTAQ